LRTYKPSDENLAALAEAVALRNQFVEELFERRKDNRDDLPEVLSGSLENLLYGAHGHLAFPFQRLPKPAGRGKNAG
jgi:hypothetical protein